MRKFKDHEIPLTSMVDVLDFAPAEMGSRICVDLDVSMPGQRLWFQQQLRSPGESFALWRRIADQGPFSAARDNDGGDVLFGSGPDLFGPREPHTTHWKESTIDGVIADIEGAGRGIRVVRDAWTYED